MIPVIALVGAGLIYFAVQEYRQAMARIDYEEKMELRELEKEQEDIERLIYLNRVKDEILKSKIHEVKSYV